MIERSKEWWKNNKEYKAKYFKEYQNNNKDKIKAYQEKRQNKNHSISKKEWESCKQYFDNKCAYCGVTEQEAKKEQGQYFHKEHMIHDGSNGIENCVPACKSCNSSKHIYGLEDWYKQQKYYTEERYNKIIKWVTEDYKYIKKSK